MHALPSEWKETISMHNGSLENLLFKTIILSRKTKSFDLPNITVMNCTRYKL